MGWLWTAFENGGFFMIPIAVMLIAGTVVIVERFYQLLYVQQSDGPELMKQVQKLLMDNNLEGAVRICSAKPEAAINQVFKAGLINSDRPPQEIQEYMEVASLGVLPQLQKRMPYLFTIANVATLLGLLGTIIGLIKTFEAVGAVEGSQKQVLLSAGISTAMNTTAFGLIVAIPCMLAYGFLSNRITHIIDDIEYFSSKLLILLRTGSEFFDRYQDQEFFSTEQVPLKANSSDSHNGGEDAA